MVNRRRQGDYFRGAYKKGGLALITTILTITIALFAGTYIGSQHSTNRTPENWTPYDHQEMLKICSKSCGKKRLADYDAIYGVCSCRRK
jgi:hypothetical protein